MNINRTIETLLMIKSKKRNIVDISLNEFKKYDKGNCYKKYCLIIITMKKKKQLKTINWFSSKIRLLEWLIDYEKQE